MRGSTMQDQGRVRRAAAHAWAEETLALTGHPVGGVCPFGLASLPVYLDISLRVRPGLSGGRLAQHFGRGAAGPPVRLVGKAGSTYAACPRNLPGLKSAERDGLGGPCRLGDQRIPRGGGHRRGRLQPNPPCPASQKKPSAAAIEAHGRMAVGGERAKARPAALDPLTFTVVRSSIRCAASATSYSSGRASQGWPGTSSIGEANRRRTLGREIEFVADRLGEGRQAVRAGRAR